MEPLGAVASVIAIGQAIGAIPSLIESVRAFSNVEGDLDGLRNEVTAIQTDLKWIRSTVELIATSYGSSQFAVTEPPPFLRARESLETICRELEGIIIKFQKNSENDNVLNMRRFRWMWKSKDIKALVAKLGSSRVQLGLGLNQMLQVSTFLAQRQMSVEMIAAISQNILASMPHPMELTVSSPPVSKLEVETIHSSTDLLSLQGISPINYVHDFHDDRPALGLQSLETIIAQDSPGGHEASIPAKPPDGKTAPLTKCSTQPDRHLESCRCQCHARRIEYRGLTSSTTLLGRFDFRYDGLPVPPNRCRCNHAGCQNQNSTLHFQYYFPRWLWARAVSISASMRGAMSSTQICLTVSRIIAFSDRMWYAIQKDNALRFQQLFMQEPYRPEDQSPDGNSLLRHAIEWNSLDIIVFLFRAWNLDTAFRWHDRRAILRARTKLLSRPQGLEERKKHLLKKVAALDNTYDDDSGVLTGPQAVILGADVLKDLLAREPSIVHDTDDCDATALHNACVLGSLDAVEMLIKAGASLNARNCDGQTPLLVSLLHGHISCARALTDAHCDVGIADSYGDNALYHGMRHDITSTFEIMQEMINRQPEMVTTHNALGENIICWLAKDVYKPSGLMKQLLGLVLRAGAALDSRNIFGRSPLLEAIFRGNGLAVQLLLEAGANPKLPEIQGHNSLHTAALFGTVDTLRALADAKITGFDVDMPDIYGDSPLDNWKWRRYANKADFHFRVTHPTAEENILFEDLLQGIRDRTFQADIELCKSVLQAVEDKDAARARELIEPMTGTGSVDEASRHKACLDLRTNVMMQIKGGLWESAAIELEHMIESRRRRIGIPPSQDEYMYNYEWEYEYETDSEDEAESEEDDVEDEEYDLASEEVSSDDEGDDLESERESLEDEGEHGDDEGHEGAGA